MSKVFTANTISPWAAPAEVKKHSDYNKAEGTEEYVPVDLKETVHGLFLYDFFPYDSFFKRTIVTHV